MKNTKKIFALLIAMIMVLGMSTMAFAASDYTITVNGTAKDGVYTAYKIFDATLSDDNDISYTVASGSALETLLRGEESEAKTAFLAAFNISDNGGKIYVTGATSDEAAINWLKNNYSTYAIKTAATVTNSTGATSVTLDVGEAGYYYITSTLGTKSAVMVTSTNPSVTINDKIVTTPTVTEDMKTIKVDGEEVSVADIELGTKVSFEVEFTATNYVVDANGTSTIITTYTVEDAPDGFEIDEDTIAVALDQEQSAPAFTKNVDEDGKMTVVITWASSTTTGEGDDAVTTYAPLYINPTVVKVTYDATLVKKTSAENSANVKYNDTGFGEDVVKVYNYSVKVTKVDAADNSKLLDGAEFAIKNSDGKYYAISADGKDVNWVDDIADATTYTTGDTGIVTFEGLAAGSYTLVEVTAPKGYNLAADTPITLNDITAEVDDTTSLTVPYTVGDQTGSVLPSTGGIGTTIFYVVGGCLVAAAVVLLITKKRMTKEN